MKKSPKWVYRGLLIVVGTCLGLGLTEIVLRVVAPAEESARQNTVFHPTYGTVRRDSWVFEFEVDGTSDQVTLRGQTIARVPAPGERRVLFIGDSGTEGVRLGIEDTYPQLLRELLDDERPDHDITVINAGVFGMTNVDELHFLEGKLVALHPQVVEGLTPSSRRTRRIRGSTHSLSRRKLGKWLENAGKPRGRVDMRLQRTMELGQRLVIEDHRIERRAGFVQAVAHRMDGQSTVVLASREAFFLSGRDDPLRVDNAGCGVVVIKAQAQNTHPSSAVALEVRFRTRGE